MPSGKRELAAIVDVPEQLTTKILRVEPQHRIITDEDIFIIRAESKSTNGYLPRFNYTLSDSDANVRSISAIVEPMDRDSVHYTISLPEDAFVSDSLAGANAPFVASLFPMVEDDFARVALVVDQPAVLGRNARLHFQILPRSVDLSDPKVLDEELNNASDSILSECSTYLSYVADAQILAISSTEQTVADKQLIPFTALVTRPGQTRICLSPSVQLVSAFYNINTTGKELMAALRWFAIEEQVRSAS